MNVMKRIAFIIYWVSRLLLMCKISRQPTAGIKAQFKFWSWWILWNVVINTWKQLDMPLTPIINSVSRELYLGLEHGFCGFNWLCSEDSFQVNFVTFHSSNLIYSYQLCIFEMKFWATLMQTFEYFWNLRNNNFICQLTEALIFFLKWKKTYLEQTPWTEA